jgi:hypothetical protein
MAGETESDPHGNLLGHSSAQSLLVTALSPTKGVLVASACITSSLPFIHGRQIVHQHQIMCRRTLRHCQPPGPARRAGLFDPCPCPVDGRMRRRPAEAGPKGSPLIGSLALPTKRAVPAKLALPAKLGGLPVPNSVTGPRDRDRRSQGPAPFAVRPEEWAGVRAGAAPSRCGSSRGAGRSSHGGSRGGGLPIPAGARRVLAA